MLKILNSFLFENSIFLFSHYIYFFNSILLVVLYPFLEKLKDSQLSIFKQSTKQYILSLSPFAISDLNLERYNFIEIYLHKFYYSEISISKKFINVVLAKTIKLVSVYFQPQIVSFLSIFRVVSIKVQLRKNLLYVILYFLLLHVC